MPLATEYTTNETHMNGFNYNSQSREQTRRRTIKHMGFAEQ